MFTIKDWANNTCFNGQTFDDFESAWGHIYQTYDHLPEAEFDAQMGEFEVVEVES